jgi:hypothetical protein
MAIVGFNFMKIQAEKESPATGKINIKNNVTLKSVEKAKITLGKNSPDAIKYIFEFTSRYEPKIGYITLGGEVISVEDDKKIKELVDTWKKDRRLPQEEMEELINSILTKCNIEALILSRDLNLPPPILLPKVDASSTEEKKYIG